MRGTTCSALVVALVIEMGAFLQPSFSKSVFPLHHSKLLVPLHSKKDADTLENTQNATSTIEETLTVEPVVPPVKEALIALEAAPRSRRQHFLQALPGRWGRHSAKNRAKLSSLDIKVLGTAIPSMINLAVVPLVNAVDTFWVGRMGIALALAGQAAANQAFFTLYFLINYIPTMTAPLVAAAVGSGEKDEAQAHVCESLFLSNMLGLVGTAVLCLFPSSALSLILPAGAPTLEYAKPYLQVRAISMIPVLMSATGFSAFRGMLDVRLLE